MENSDQNPIELCVVCGKETPYRFHDHVDFRQGYIEGAGQTCQTCYALGTDREHIAVPVSLIKSTPNNYELGEKVRALYNLAE